MKILADQKIRKRIFALLFLLILSALTMQMKRLIFEKFVLGYELDNKAGEQKTTLAFGGLSRSYLIHLPSNYPENAAAMPLVLVLHGAGGNAEIMRETSGMNDVADRENFVVVYPNGMGILDNYLLSWNAVECCNYFKYPFVDDVGFLKELTGNLIAEYNIDTQRIYISGISNGGMMAYYMACNFSEAISAVAPVSASMPRMNCEPIDFLSVIDIHGSADRVIPFSGGLSPGWFVNLFSLNFRSVPDAVSFWVKHNHCNKNAIEKRQGNVIKKLYDNCDEGVEVVLYAIGQSGHVWPGGKRGWILSDKPTADLVASEVIWDFFKKHHKQ